MRGRKKEGRKVGSEKPSTALSGAEDLDAPCVCDGDDLSYRATCSPVAGQGKGR